MKQGIVETLTKIFKLPLLIIKYFCVGIFITMYYILSFVITLIEYMGKGILVTLYLIKEVIYYLLYGMATPFLCLIMLFKSLMKSFEPQIQKRKEQQRIKQQQRAQEKQALAIEKTRQREIAAQEKARQKELAAQEKARQREIAAQEKARQKELVIAAKEESEERKREKQLQAEELRRKEEEKKRIQEEEIKKAKAFIAEEKARKREESQKAKKKLEKESEEAYINKNVKIDKHQNSFFARLMKKIKKSSGGVFENVKNNRFARHRKNQKDLERQVLLINFEGDDAKKSETKVLYEYVAKDPEGNVVKGYSEAYSRVEVHSYLLSEGFEVYSIKTNWWIRLMHSNAGGNRVKFKTKDLIFLLTQLSTYLKAGITLVEALRILSRQYKKKSYQSILKAVVYDLTMGDNLSDAMEKQNVAFPKLLINMVKTAEMTGELPEVLDDMVEYYSEMEQTRKQMITALTYPSLVFVFAVAVITFILVFVIPQFTDIYTSMEGVEIPTFTLIVMAASDFLTEYAVLILIVFIIFCIIYAALYKNVRSVRMFTQWIVMHIPVIGNTVIYNEVTTFTKTFSSLLSHSVFITDSMDILNKITNNEIYKMIILDTITNLAKGEKISKAFKNHWAFPLPAYEMLVTGETTGELPEMMKKVSSYYQMLHKDSVTRLKTFIEPVLTIFLTGIVGVIVLAIIVPMFGMYNSIQAY